MSLEKVFTISGTLTDHKGDPLISAKVALRFMGEVIDTTVTDFDGRYTFAPFDDERAGNFFELVFTWNKIQQMVTDIKIREYATVVNHRLNTAPPISAYTISSNGILGKVRRYTRWQRMKMKVKRVFQARRKP